MPMDFTAAYYEQCVSYALAQKGLQAETFKDTNLRVYQRRIASDRAIFKALSKKGIIIPLVEASLLGSSGVEPIAVVLLASDAVKQTVTFYNPITDQTEQASINNFIRAWKNGGGLCTTAFPADDTYRPKLIDLSHVQLPGDMDELLEAMAENVHDRWALERQSEGWTYGSERDDQQLLTPDMVPYSQLPESEKEYDRLMALETLRLLYALGYKVVRNSD